MRKMLNFLSVAGMAVFLVSAVATGDSDSKSNSSPSTTKESKKKDVEIVKTSDSYESFTNSYTIHCRVRNNTSKLIQYLDITATFYDKKGNIVGTGIGNCVNLAGGSEKTVDVIGLDIDNVDSYEVQIDNVM